MYRSVINELSVVAEQKIPLGGEERENECEGLDKTERGGKEQNVADKNRTWWTRIERGGQEQNVVDKNRTWWTRTERGGQEQNVVDKNSTWWT